MNTTDLRIGNLIYNDYTKCNGEIMGIFSYEEVWIQYPNESITSRGTIFACHGIPITEEWLVKFGFKYRCIEIDSQVIEINKSNFFYLFGVDSVTSGDCFNGVCEYVHQLQNLYYALTQTELTINL